MTCLYRQCLNVGQILRGILDLGSLSMDPIVLQIREPLQEMKAICPLSTSIMVREDRPWSQITNLPWLKAQSFRTSYCKSIVRRVNRWISKIWWTWRGAEISIRNTKMWRWRLVTDIWSVTSRERSETISTTSTGNSRTRKSWKRRRKWKL